MSSAIRFVEQVDLSYQQNSLSLSFAAPEVSLAPKMIYEYRVDGLDNEWFRAVAGQQTISYARLSPGDFKFRIRAALDATSPFGPEAVLAVHITPPLWRTVWAYLAYVILVGGTIWTLIRQRFNRMRQATELLEKTVARERPNSRQRRANWKQPTSNCARQRNRRTWPRRPKALSWRT